MALMAKDFQIQAQWALAAMSAPIIFLAPPFLFGSGTIVPAGAIHTVKLLDFLCGTKERDARHAANRPVGGKN